MDWELEGKPPAYWCNTVNVQPPAANCDASADKVLALGKQLKVAGTPTLFFADGTRSPGYLPAAELEKALNDAAKL